MSAPDPSPHGGRDPVPAEPLPQAPAQSPRERATARLQVSRAALTRALRPEAETGTARDRERSGAQRPPWRSWARHARRRWRGSPWAMLVGEAGQQWWQRHPWRPTGELLFDEGRRHLWPTIRRHPILCVGLVAAAGAAILAFKPWRQPALARQLHGWASSARRWLWRELHSLPLQALLSAAVGLWAAQQERHGSSPQTQPAADGPDQPVTSGSDPR